ncbi:hypothetical protein, partial [Escherichia coli]|uniref:hypothetical protein n=1 Tax=Escherichia coli TaxID=562 RepID=UPI0021C10731
RQVILHDSNAKFQRVLWFAHKMHLTQLVSNFWGAVQTGRGAVTVKLPENTTSYGDTYPKSDLLPAG